MSKANKLAALQEEYADCKKCKLCESRKHVVFGDGNPTADILIVGESPGAEEDKSGKPFKGDAGNILARFFAATNLDRDTDTYLCNVIMCRPTVEVEDERTGEKRLENRTPTKEERFGCRERLLKTIYAIDPLIIVALGRVPFQALTGKGTIITKARGEIQTMHLQGKHVEVRYPVFPMYHPSSLIRSFDYKEGGPWWQTGQDWSAVCSIVDCLRETYYGRVAPERKAGADETSAAR